MKQFLSILLSLALLASLCACGGEPSTSDSAIPAAPESMAPESPAAPQKTGGYIIPASWTETSINDGAWGYVTSAAEEDPDGEFSRQGPYLVHHESDPKTGTQLIIRRDLDGNELDRASFTLLPAGGDVEENIGQFRYVGDTLFTIRNTYVFLDRNAGQVEMTQALERRTPAGELLDSVSLEDALGLGEDGFVGAMQVSPEGELLLSTDRAIFWLDQSGVLLAKTDTNGLFFGFQEDAAGRLYLRSFQDDMLYTVDWENRALGEPVMALDLAGNIQTGSGPYDFFLIGDTTLRGVSFSAGTITEILSWDDLDLTGSVHGVEWLDEEHMEVQFFNVMTLDSSPLLLTRVPADQVPAKTAVTLAVGLDETMQGFGATWSDFLPEEVRSAITEFGLTDPDFRIEVVTYPDAQALQVMLAAGDSPDLIDWNTAWLSEGHASPSLELLARRGALMDLEPLLEADEELDESLFIPSLMELERDRAGGLYALPLGFYFVTLLAPAEYVGQEPGWSISDLLHVAETLPEGMELWSYISQTDMLSTMLRTNLSHFVDADRGTCSFETQEFYDLLTLSRDYFPKEIDEYYTEPGQVLLEGVPSMGMVSFAADTLLPARQQGRTVIGYPGAGGPATIIFYDELSIFSGAQHPEAAWRFMKLFFTYDVQKTMGRAFTSSVRLDAFLDRDRELLDNGSYADIPLSAVEEVEQMVLDARSLRISDNPVIDIVLEEAEAFFAGDKSAQDTARIIQGRVMIYLSEQS